MRRVSYQGILRQRLVVAGLTLGLLTVIAGVSIELYMSTQRTTLSPTIQQLIQPLDPLINLDVIEDLEDKTAVTPEQAKARVEQIVSSGAPTAVEEEALPVLTTPTNPGQNLAPEPVVEEPAPPVEEQSPFGDEALSPV